MTVNLAELTIGKPSVCRLSDAALIMIDAQNTYTTGVLKLHGIEPAMIAARQVLEKARESGAPVIHIMHDAGPGTPFDVTAEIGQIAPAVAPIEGEITIVKTYPNSFVETDLHDRLKAMGIENLIFAGFMTHMCINSTVRAAFDLGYRNTVVGSATATRPLALPERGVIDAESLHQGSLAALADIFATVVPTADDLPS
ncbi:MAG: cysteine hydrolase [Cyanothece sp. SIO1E1]|nr:cysteine hydrolase [Cyanothece sp. SIO1E1]